MINLLVTGSRGLIGSSLTRALSLRGYRVHGLDWSYPRGHRHHGDILERSSIAKAMRHCDGVIHLAAISRVGWGERDPQLCHDVNALGTRNLLQCATSQPRKPWVIVASSREVYGEPEALPVTEDCPKQPFNHYGQSKLATETLVNGLSDQIATAILRFANVYGSINDHPDRVVPAFIHGALRDQTLSVHGPGNAFDFTHVDDVVHGIILTVQRLQATSRSLPPMHFATGMATSLGELAQLAVGVTESSSAIDEVASRSSFVSRFVGDPARAEEVLGFRCRIPIEAGLAQLALEMAEPNDRSHAQFPTWVGSAVA